MNPQKIIGEIRSSLNTKYKERTELIDNILLTFLARQNGCVIGVPGIAKSAVLRGITDLLQEPCFSILLTKTTMPEEVLGMLEFESATQGVQKRNTAGYLPESKVGFFDEIWKSSGAIRNALLTIINERIFRNGAEEIDVPLWSVWGASNEYPQSEEDAAMWDRFLVRLEVKEIQESASFIDMLKTTCNTKLSISAEAVKALKDGAIEKAQVEVKNLPVDDEVYEAMVELRVVLRNLGVKPSDRRWLASLDMIKAITYMKGKAKADKTDMTVLENILWDTPEQKDVVKTNIMRLVAPYKYQVYILVQECEDIMANVGTKTLNAIEAIKKINSLIDKVKVLIGDSGISEDELKYANYVLTQFERKAGDLGKKLIGSRA